MKNVELHELNRKNTQQKFEWAVTYLAYGELGRGLDSKKFDAAMLFAKQWKVNLVQYLMGKPIWGKEGKFHTKDTATATADALFRKRYNAEVKAHQSPTINTYWTREAGSLEFGRDVNSVETEGSGINEDGMAVLVDRSLSRWDEEKLVPNKREWTPPVRQKKNYGQFLVYLARGVSPGRVLYNAKRMMWNYAITKEQFQSLVENAGEIYVTAMKSKTDQVEDLV